MSEKIQILIGLLNETEKFNTKFNSDSYSESEANADLVMIQSILYDAIETVAKKINSTSHHVERILNDVIVNGDMRLNIVHFCRNIKDWLVTGDKSALKEVLIKNISEDDNDSDLQAIEIWYRGE
ncbi:MAG: hypothetical protein K2J40_04215 [Ruminococcus sp.]|nr:hypothetical protein [Ruminococcus sp.]